MVSKDLELPFFPHYETEHVCNGSIRVTWFEPKFSQSHYNVYNKTNGSNACTLIAVLMASKCHEYNVIVNHPQDNLNIRLIHLLAISMLEGNKIHENLKIKKVLKHLNLNVPEAMKYAENQASDLVEWKSLIFMESLSKSLFQNIKINWIEWVKAKRKEACEDLYVILVADSRTVLFLIQNKTETVTLFDSHQHSLDKGAFIAITNRTKLGHLCYWFLDVLGKCYNSDPKLYELSFLYFRKK